MKLLRALRLSVSYQKSGIIKASEPIIYKVISNTQNYPAFIPFVNAAKITKKISDHENYTQLTVSYGSFKELSYLSHVKMHPATKLGDKSWIHSYCKDAPLKKLNSIWEIQGKDERNSYVNYTLDF